MAHGVWEVQVNEVKSLPVLKPPRIKHHARCQGGTKVHSVCGGFDYVVAIGLKLVTSSVNGRNEVDHVNAHRGQTLAQGFDVGFDAAVFAPVFTQVKHTHRGKYRLLSLIVSSFLVSVISTLWARRWFSRHTASYSSDVPQRFHAGAVPRLGGLGMLIGWLVGLSLAIGLPALGVANGVNFKGSDFALFTLLGTVATLVGAVEDLTQKMSVRWRLVLTGALGASAVCFWGLSVTSLGVQVLDPYWQAAPVLGMALAMFAITGLPHAFNIIDGYNGLAGIVALMVGIALAHVALQVGDRELAAVVLCLAAVTAGFLVWNYPRGLVFAGDGGAYLWGVVVASVSIALVQRHPQVSPWFPVLLLIYPVWETFFSMYRKWMRGSSPGMADAMHLHQLVYRRLVRRMFGRDEAALILARNNRTTPYLAAFSLMSVVPAMLFWKHTWVLQLFALLFVVTYVYAYIAIVRFRVPKWFRR